MYFEIAHKMSTTTFALIIHLIKAAGTDLYKAVSSKGIKGLFM